MSKLNRESKRLIKGGALAAFAIGAALAIGGGATATAAGEIRVLSAAGSLERSLELDVTRQRYGQVYEQADDLGVAPARNQAEIVARDFELEASLEELRGEVRDAKAEERRAERRDEASSSSSASSGESGSPESVGVSTATLESIAACESGGDPAAVSSDGTYRGKYQFDLTTWASVGGSGDPASAPEAEQDYRAALLYSQSGASPWPVCG